VLVGSLTFFVFFFVFSAKSLKKSDLPNTEEQIKTVKIFREATSNKSMVQIPNLVSPFSYFCSEPHLARLDTCVCCGSGGDSVSLLFPFVSALFV
jgi:hypothetical protein